MREIKFRIWDNNYNKYDKQGLAINKQGHVFIPKSGTFVENAIIEQYTGIKDKNGVEIYEGDKVRVKYGYCGNPHMHDNTRIGVIKFRNGYFSYVNESDIYEYEVIGNIHEEAEK